MSLWDVTVKHDAGRITLRVCADTEDGARDIVMRVEKCPSGAIVTITAVKAI